MSDAVKFDLNTEEFQKTLNQYLAFTSRDLPSALNTKMFYIARGASRLTPKANRSSVEQELGVVGYAVKIGKRGKPLMRDGRFKWDKLYSRKVTVANLIINSRKGKAGKKGLYGQEMLAAVVDMIRKRTRSIGTLKAGWLGAIRTFGSAIGQSGDIEQLSSHIKGRTKAKIATPGFSPSCSLEYLTNSYTTHPEHMGYIDKRVEAALNQAYKDEMASMEKYIIEKMQGRANKMAGRKMGPEAAMAEIQRAMRGGA
jgi:hypothetical protein